jgi:hypothetical protein
MVSSIWLKHNKYFQMKKWQLPVAAVMILLAVSFKPFHHGWANYDQTKTLDYVGTVEEFTFENPHASARVKDKKKTWLVILAPTSRMESRGVPSDKIVKGSKLRVVGYPHKKVKDEMRAERIYVDNVKFELR